MRLLPRFIDWFGNSWSHAKKAPKTSLDQANTAAPIEPPNAAVRGGDSQDVPVRFYARLSPETPLAALLRDGEIAPSGPPDRALGAHGSWEPVSTFYYSSGATSYYNYTLDQWFAIDQEDLLEYLKELRRLLEASLPTGSSDLDVAIERAHQIKSLRAVRAQAREQEPGSPDPSTTIDCYDHFFQKQFGRVLAFTLRTLVVPSYKGLTIEHLLSLHEKGYKSISDILNAPDAVLLSISGIGPKRVTTIRANLSNSMESKPQSTSPVFNDPVGTVSARVGARVGLPPLELSFAYPPVLHGAQQSFFEHFKRELGAGRRVEVGQDVGYLYLYSYSVLASKDCELIVPALKALRTLYPENAKLSARCSEWISDTYAITGKYEEALQAFPKLQIGSRSGIPTSRKLSLRLAVGSEVEPIEILTLFGPKVTKFVRGELDLVERYIGVLLAEHEGHDHRRLLDEWPEHSTRAAIGYPFYDGTALANAHLELPFYWFSASRYIEDFCLEVTRDAENAIRGDQGLPGVGEGWISETRLYYEVKEALPARKVVPHASPNWLGRQHLDIFLPEDLVAIEFQGEQHDKPIEFFGGVKAFEENIRRDRRKKRLCEENGVCLIYVREGYVLEEVVEAIRTRSGVGGEVR